MPSFEFSEEEKQLSETAREFARKEIIPVAGELDERGTFPIDICKKGWETGLMNCELPEAYGGLGLSWLSHCLVLEEISYGCTGINTTMAGNMLGTMPLLLAGTDSPLGELADRICEVLEWPYELSGVEAVLGCSVGVAVYPQDGTTSEDLIRAADAAMYRRKRENRDAA